jgi:hypothetical protein
MFVLINKIIASFVRFPWYCHVSFAFSIIFRIPGAIQDLPPYIFCDEEIFIKESYSLQDENRIITNEFRSGGLNIYLPLIVFKLVSRIFNVDDEYTFYIVLARILMVIISSATIYVLYLLSNIIFYNTTINKFTILGFAFSPTILAHSRYWYPDHFLIFFSSLFLYFLVKNYKENFTMINYLKFNIVYALLVSVKYTSLIFLPLIWLSILSLNLKGKKIFFSKVKLKLVIGSNIIGLVTFLVINFSIFLQPREFVSDFLFNLNNYGRSGGLFFQNLSFNLVVLFLLSLNIFGGLIALYGVIYTLNSGKNTFLIPLLLFSFIYLLVLSQAGLVLSRNLILVYPLVLIFFGQGCYQLWTVKKNFSPLRVIVIISISFQVINTAYVIIHDLAIDSRIIAEDRLKFLIPKGSSVGVNEGCSGPSPAAISGYKTITDPFFNQDLEYYVINSYWDFPLKSQYRNTNILQSIDQKYIHFYSFSNTDLFSYSFNQRNLDSIPNYSLIELINSNGPDILVYKKVE